MHTIFLLIKPEGKGPLGRTSSRWKHNIRTDFRDIGWEGVDWIHLAQDRYQWRVLELLEYLSD
jgi:hypothetical protein